MEMKGAGDKNLVDRYVKEREETCGVLMVSIAFYSLEPAGLHETRTFVDKTRTYYSAYIDYIYINILYNYTILSVFKI